MADWTDPPYAQLVAGKPWTDEKASAAYENVVAAREGAVGAPYERSAWHPYDGTAIGDGLTGMIYDFSVDGGLVSRETPLFEDGYEYRLLIEAISHNGGASESLQYSLYRETDAAYAVASAITLSAVAASVLIYANVEIYRPRIAARYCFTTQFWPYVAMHQDDLTNLQKVSKAKIHFSSASIDSGKIYLYRRLCYA